MSVSDQAVSFPYQADGTSVNFSYPSYVINATDLIVTYRDSTGLTTTKILNTDYIVNGLKNQHLNAYINGAVVVFNVAPVAGGQVRITRKTARTQPAIFTPNDPFLSGSHEGTIDRQMLVIQEILASWQIVGSGDGPPSTGVFHDGDMWWNLSKYPGGTVAWVYLTHDSSGVLLPNPGWYEWGPIATGPV